ncbi:hypothetical protein [Salinigranum sp. GCM10025319]|uniref:DUF7847 domain-containing protein n=1 Tax=Salinigranum sp. GCM10025319 TaxID=3252687 RepID=UPI003618608E
MAVLQALQTAGDAVRRNPVLLVAAAAFGLLQLPGLVAQSIDPLVGAVVSLGFSGIAIFVTPFFLGGILGMANEAIDGRTSLDAFVDEGKSNYVSLLVVYFVLVAINFVLGIVGFFAAIVGGALWFSGGGGQSNLVPLAIVAAVAGVALLGYLLVVFVTQFFGHAVVVDDCEAVESLKRSAWCVRHNLLAVVGYTLLVGIGGGVFGLVAGLFSVLTTPSAAGTMGGNGVGSTPAATPLPVDLPSVGLPGTVVLVLLLLLVTGLFGGFFAAYSTAFYRQIRPASAPTTAE